MKYPIFFLKSQEIKMDVTASFALFINDYISKVKYFKRNRVNINNAV